MISYLCVSRLNIYTSPKQLIAANHCPSQLVTIFVIGGSVGGNCSSYSTRHGVKVCTSSELPTSTTCGSNKCDSEAFFSLVTEFHEKKKHQTRDFTIFYYKEFHVKKNGVKDFKSQSLFNQLLQDKIVVLASDGVLKLGISELENIFVLVFDFFFSINKISFLFCKRKMGEHLCPTFPWEKENRL